MEGKIAVLGGDDFVMPFSALGLDTFASEDSIEQVEQTALKIVEGNYALVVVAENIAPLAEKVFETQKNMATPAIVVVPFTSEPTGYATKDLGKALKMATGIDILNS